MKKITYKLITKIANSGIILIIILFLYGIIGSYFIMGLNFIDSIYYAVITMATVGYGDLIPVSGIQKLFTTSLALCGIVLLAYLFNIILTNFQEKMSNYSKGAGRMKVIDQMNNYYILCGYGRVGKVVFNELKNRNQNIILIEKDEEVCDEIEENNSIIILNKDATESELITKLAGEKCQSVIISTGSDVTNLFIVLTIRETNPDAWIVTRASKLENISRLKKAGANKIISPEVIGGKDLYLESAKPHLLRLTVKHRSDEIYEEFKTITKYNCTLENIDYHLPGIETPLNKEIKTMGLDEGKKFAESLLNNKDKKEAIDNLYNAVNDIHSHLISGPTESFDKLITDLEKHEEIIGKNLTNKEIAEITKKYK